MDLERWCCRWPQDGMRDDKASLVPSSAFVKRFCSMVLSKWVCKGTVVLEKTLKSPLDSKEINPVNPKGNQP